MVAYASITVASLQDLTDDEVIAQLLKSDAVSGFTQVSHEQLLGWRTQIGILRELGERLIAHSPRLSDVGIVLEYRIPRRDKRIDAALLLPGAIAIVEFKNGGKTESATDIAQVLDYALDIAYYHEESRGRSLIPILCPTNLVGARVHPSGEATLIEDLVVCGAKEFIAHVVAIAASGLAANGEIVRGSRWSSSRYRPIPGVIDATVRLFSKHEVGDIKSALADEGEIAATIDYVERLVSEAHQSREKVLCLLTGVPGAGKTLTGLQIAHLEGVTHSGWSSIFMSGNGPLLKVLRAALTRDYSERQGISLARAKSHADSLLHGVHSYIAECSSNALPPHEHVVIFDEAQRAWDESKMQKMQGRARRFSGDDENGESESPVESVAKSEPWQILDAMSRHDDGAVVIALCGNGQEIHDGEAGVGEWIETRAKSFPSWRLECSPVAAEIGALSLQSERTTIAEELHLRVPMRSHRASGHAVWVDAVLAGDATVARQNVAQDEFPIVLSRSLDEVRQWLWRNTMGSRRCGLLASSGAGRIRPDGLEVSAEFRKGVDYSLWFTADRSDIRSSNALEVAATEFECQGLELDRTGVCWAWDLSVQGAKDLVTRRYLAPRAFRATKWVDVKTHRDRRYVLNKYRVLLTRAREGMAIWVPSGQTRDSTRSPSEADAIAEFLISCGVRRI